MAEFLHGPDNALPDFNEKGMQDFLDKPGAVIDIQHREDKSIYPNAIKNHAIVPINNLHCKEAHEVDENSDTGYLIEHLATGLHYFVYKDQVSLDAPAWIMDKEEYRQKALQEKSSYRTRGVIDFKGTQEKPHDIVLTWEEYKRWHRSALDIPGTRIGGVPLNSDGTPYSGLWPYLKDGNRLSFLSQYELKDGRYIHIFIGHDFDDYDYSEMEGDEDPYACAVIEGGPVPSWIQMKPWEEEGLALVHPNDAYILERHNKEILPAPEWIQDDYTPGTGEYKFLIQIGDTSDVEDEMSFVWGDGGDLYIFADLETNRVQAIMQCS